MSPRSRIPVAASATVLAILGLLLAAGSSPAEYGCGGVEIARPTKNVNPGGHPPLAIGDSTMLLALPTLAHEGYRADAHGCRQISEGLRVIRKAKRHDRLPHLVVIALGTDADIGADQLEAAFHLLGPKRVLGLVTPLELGGWSGHDARVVRKEARRHPARAILLDWVKHSKGRSSWFQPDGVHLTLAGATAFAKMLRRALPYARAGEHPGEHHGR